MTTIILINLSTHIFDKTKYISFQYSIFIGMEQMLSSTYDWENKLILGQGAHSVAYKVKHRNRQQYFAIKQFKRKSAQCQQSFRNELQCLKKVKHHNIIKLFSSFQGNQMAWQVLEYCQSNLRRLMHISGKNIQIPEREAVSIVRQIIQGMVELNKHNLIHRDLKPENILIKDKIIKLCDFGLTVYCSSNSPFNNYCGTPQYMSPQVASAQSYTSKADVWSLGIIYYEMLYGTTPWQLSQTTNYKNYIRDNPLKFPSGVLLNYWSRNFIQRCLQFQEKDRMDWDQVVSHPLVNLGKKMVSQIEVLQTNQLVQKLSNLYLNDPKDLEYRYFEDAYDNSLNMIQFLKKTRRIYPQMQITPRQNRLIFEKLDGNKNGKVTLDQFKKVMIRLSSSSIILDGIRQKVKQKIITAQIFTKAGVSVDTLFLDEKQFQSLVRTINSEINPSQIKKLFQRMDKDQDRKISRRQICQIFQLIQPSRVPRLKSQQSIEIIPMSLKVQSPRKSPMNKSLRSSRNYNMNKA